MPSSRLRPWQQQARLFSHFTSRKPRFPFGIAFDIDGVLVRGGQPIERATQALQKLYKGTSNNLRVPFILLTNGGGARESVKASEFSRLLGVKILPEQVFLGHTPFKGLVERFQNLNVLATGKGEPATVMVDYGYRNVISMENYVSGLKDIDPLANYKQWTCDQGDEPKKLEKVDHIDAVFIVSDPVDWGRDIQVICDVLRSGGYPGRRTGNQPPLFFAADDFEYQAAFPVERLGMGAFRMALETIYNRIGEHCLAYTSFGKPKVAVFRTAELQLQRIAAAMDTDHESQPSLSDFVEFETIYMIGDNPATDIQGARQAGKPWFSILTRTGCFKDKGNHKEHPADLVVDSVQDAVQYIMTKHSLEVY